MTGDGDAGDHKVRSAWAAAEEEAETGSNIAGQRNAIPDAGSDGETESSRPSGSHNVVEVHLSSSQVQAIERVGKLSKGRQRWSSRLTYILAVVGAVVGLGNIWRFPYLAYKNGGALFIFPYVFFLGVLGLPLLLLETSLGQSLQSSATRSFEVLDPKYRGLGLATFTACAVIGCYYVGILSWVGIYLVNSFRDADSLPWSKGKALSFFEHDVLNMTDSVANTGDVQPHIFASLLIFWILVFICVVKGTESLKWAVYVTVPLPYIVLVILFFRGVTLEGADQGLEFYFKPDLAKLFSSPTPWVEAAAQIFFSLSVGTGVCVTFGSYNNPKEPILKNSITVALINSLTSLFGGMAMFAILGYMAKSKEQPIDEVVKEAGPGFVFVIVPEALALMPAASFFSFLFFFMLASLGLDSAFSLVEAAVGVLRDEVENAVQRFKDRGLPTPRLLSHLSTPWAVPLWCCLAGLLIGLLFCTRAGVHWIGLFDHFVSDYLLTGVCLMEFIVISWGYGFSKYEAILKHTTGQTVPFLVAVMWRFVGPFLMVLLLIFAIVHEVRDPVEGSTPWSLAIGWITCLTPFLWWGKNFIHSRHRQGLSLLDSALCCLHQRRTVRMSVSMSQLPKAASTKIGGFVPRRASLEQEREDLGLKANQHNV